MVCVFWLLVQGPVVISHMGQFLGHLKEGFLVVWFGIPKYFGIPFLLLTVGSGSGSVNRISPVWIIVDTVLMIFPLLHG